MTDRLDRLLVQASRTFALTIPLLDPPLRRVMGLAYLLMRNADTLEDAWRVPRRKRATGLRDFIGLVQRLDVPAAERFADGWRAERRFDDPDHHEVLLATAEIVAALADCDEAPIVTRHVVRVAERMAGWVTAHDARGRLSLTSIRALDDYCYAVAGIVGEMITELIAARGDLAQDRLLLLRATAVDFGAGLQLTNILKDVHRDAAQGRRYIPAEFLPSAIGAGSLQPIVLLALARLDQGIEYTCALPTPQRGARLFCLVPLVLAAETLVEIDRRSDALWAGDDVKIARADVMRLLGDASAAVDDAAAIRALWARLTAPLRALRLALSA